LNSVEGLLDKLNRIDQEISSDRMLLTNKIKEYNEICKSLGVESIDDPSLNDADEFQQQQDEQVKKKDLEKNVVFTQLNSTREQLNKIIAEKGSLQGNLKSKLERFTMVNSVLIKQLSKIFSEMQDDFEDAYRMQSLFSSKNGQGAYAIVNSVVEKFKTKRTQV
jgi:regulator of replication initiation timing